MQTVDNTVDNLFENSVGNVSEIVAGIKTENIGYTPSAAQRIIEAARLITSVPVVRARQNTNRKPIPTQTKKIVWKRDQGKCQYKDINTGKMCGSQHLLEYDHIKRVRHGGDDHPNNLRLLCKPHL